MTTVSGFELGKFRGEVEARLTGHDKGIEELANGLAEVSVTCNRYQAHAGETKWALVPR